MVITFQNSIGCCFHPYTYGENYLPIAGSAYPRRKAKRLEFPKGIHFGYVYVYVYIYTGGDILEDVYWQNFVGQGMQKKHFFLCGEDGLTDLDRSQQVPCCPYRLHLGLVYRKEAATVTATMEVSKPCGSPKWMVFVHGRSHKNVMIWDNLGIFPYF